MDISFEETNRDLLHFISKSPSVFHVVRHIKAALLYAGFTEIREEDSWQIKRGGKYVVTRNGSALIAFSVPEDGGNAFKITAAHCDSPTFKIKENPEMRDGKYTRLNVEGYGGMIMSTWLDRPLSAAGRLFVKDNGQIISKLVSLDHPTLLIPSVAIHMDRTVNSGHAWNVQNDLLPLYSTDGAADFMETLAQAAKVKAADILGHDIFLYSCSPGILWGPQHEFISSPRLDDLQCAFATFRGFTNGKKQKDISVYALFDNEEVGSGTAQGAGSTFLTNTISRLALSLGRSYDEIQAMLAKSFMISADNGHAVHPNHGEYADPVNAPVLNGGIIIKFNASQKYSTDGYSAAIFRDLCLKADVPLQTYTNRSDIPGGSTLGNISNTKVAVPTVDIGLPQLAMHSSYETAGAKDTEYLVKACTAFF
ncbi:MAG: M18 family aminopeptidase [Dialister sp.]|nr:M18 family aminopeptidase [Dialister sp.]